MAVKQKKRRWSSEEKRSICFQTTAAGVSVAQVARRYAMNAKLIFKWLKDERYVPDVDAVPEEDEPLFLSVEVEASASPGLALPACSANGLNMVGSFGLLSKRAKSI
jgi:transposase